MHEDPPMGKTMRALGLMSGTSMDGIDVALIETDGEESLQRGPSATFPYSAEVRGQLKAAIDEAKRLERRDERPGVLAVVERHLTELHADAVGRFLADRKLDAAAIDIIGFHGQTVLHRSVVAKVFVKAEGTGEPGVGKARVIEDRRTLTVQLGDGPLLAKLTGIDVVYDLRAADCAAGGQGAPLAPVYHRALAAKLPERPVVVLNIGGVANATWIGRDGTLIAFDTGPGNALLDDWMARHTGASLDADGRAAAGGRIDADALTALLTHDYFGKLPPKSLDRNAFSPAPLAGLSLEDGAATLTAFTAAGIARACEHFPEQPRLWVISGGGRRNKTLMAMIAERVGAAVAPAEAAGMDGDAMEAEAWAYLAVRSLKGLPITFPGTTGAPRPLTGGVRALRS
jgi:anhydro-N-acetylmuramic acid kinase